MGSSLSYSEDGTFYKNNITNGFSFVINNANWNGKMWVAVGIDTTSNIKYSYDGKTWINASSGYFNNGGYDVCWVAKYNKWVAIGNDTSDSSKYVISSTDGISWTSLGFTGTNLLAYYTIKYDGNTTIIIGGRSDFTSSCYYSLDGGSNWSQCINAIDYDCFCLNYTGTKWIAGGYNGQIKYSNDGITWYSANIPSDYSITANYYSIGYDGKQAIICGEKSSVSLMLRSIDFINWSLVEYNSSYIINYNILWNGLYWILLSNSGSIKVRISYDNGNSWNEYTNTNIPGLSPYIPYLTLSAQFILPYTRSILPSYTGIGVYPMWYATPKTWIGSNSLTGYTGGTGASSNDCNGVYKITASSEYSASYPIKNSFDRVKTNNYLSTSGYTGHVVIQRVQSNGNPDPLYIYMKGTTDQSPVQCQSNVIISFSNDGTTYIGNTTLNMQYGGNIFPSGTNLSNKYDYLYSNYVIPSAYRSYNYIKIAGTGIGGSTSTSTFYGFNEINLLFPRNITTATDYNFYSGKPYITYPPNTSSDDYTLNGFNASNVNGYPNILYNGTDAFYFNLQQNAYVEITASFDCFSTNPDTFIINMYIDNTITTNPTSPASTSVKYISTSSYVSVNTLSWSGQLSSGYHIINFSQYIPSTLVATQTILLFNNNNTINISCIARY
jgi:hypothetical protein